MGILHLEGYTNDHADSCSEAVCLNDIAPITLLLDASGVLSILADKVEDGLTAQEKAINPGWRA